MSTKVIGFYGFKGGAGRSLLLAHLVGLLSSRGKKVLVIDCDLEAPGLGDYFDRENEPFASWRKKRGILDLLSDREALFKDGNNQWDIGRAFGEGGILNPANPTAISDYLSLTEDNSYLLGPGTHHAEVSYPQTYVSKLMELDWNLFLNSKDGPFFKEFGRILKENEIYDYVVIDGRTGYNFASVVLLQNWVTDIVAVGNLTMQSIDGIARMMPIFQTGGIKCHLAISKVPQDVYKGYEETGRDWRKLSDADSAIKLHLIDFLYNAPVPLNVYLFPFLELFNRGDKDLWGRSLDDKLQVETSGYLSQLLSLYKGTTGDESVTDADVFRSLGLESLLKKAARFDQKEESLKIPDIENQIEKLLERVDRFCRAADQKLNAPKPEESDKRIPTDDPAPTCNDAESSGFTLAARELARVRLAQRLRDLSQKRDEFDIDRIKLVRDRNGLSLLPVSIRNLPQSDTENEGGNKPIVSSQPKSIAGPGSVWRAFGAVMRDPRSEGNEQRTKEAEKYLHARGIDKAEAAAVRFARIVKDSYTALDDYDRTSIARKDAYRTGSADSEAAERAFIKALASLGETVIELGELLQDCLDHSILVPGNLTDFQSMSSLSTWNVFDAFVRYVPLASRVMASQREDVKRIAETIERKVMDHLIRSKVTEASGAENLQGLRSWGEYLRGVVECRRSVKAYEELFGPERECPRGEKIHGICERHAPHPMAAVIVDGEAESLLACLDLKPIHELPKEFYGLVEESSIAVRVRLAVLICSLSSNFKAALPMLRGIATRLVDPRHPIVSLAGSKRDPDVLAKREDISTWATLILDLARLAYEVEENSVAALLYRLALRTYWPIRMDPKTNDEFVNYAAAGLALVVFRFGLPISEETLDEVKASSGNQDYDWWSAPSLLVKGCATDAREVLLKAKDLNSSSVIFWEHQCEAYLCNLSKLQDLAISWWKRGSDDSSLFSGRSGQWIRMSIAYSGALLAWDHNDEAVSVLGAVLRLARSRKGPESDRLEIMTDVRLRLAQLRNEDPISEQRASELANAFLDKEVQDYRASLRDDSALDGDLQFRKYLTRALGEKEDSVVRSDCEGMFSGIDAPSPLRQKLADLLIEYAEILMRAGKLEEMLRIAQEVETDVLCGFDESDVGSFISVNRLAYCYPKAAALALRSWATADQAERNDLQNAAKRHLDADKDENAGTDRRRYYKGIFSICNVC